MTDTWMGSLAAQDTYRPTDQPSFPDPEEVRARQPYRGVSLDPGIRRAPGDTAMRPAAQTFGEVVGDLVIPQTPLDYGLMLAGPAAKVPKAVKFGGVALGSILNPSEAEAGKAKLLFSPFSKIGQHTPVSEIEAAVRPTSTAAEKLITPADLQGSRLLPLVGDRTAAGGELTGIGGRWFENPTLLQGGPGYIQHMGEQGAVWASDKSPVTTLLNRVKQQEAPVYGVYTAMGERAGDFSHHVSDTLMSMAKNSKITKEGAESFNTKMKAIDENWPGIRSAKAREWLASAPGAVRANFAKLMDTSEFRDAGFPRVDAARYATTDPRLLDAPTGAAGLSIGSISGRRIDPSNIAQHRTYRDVMGGEYAGGFGANVPFEVMYPDLARRYLASRPDMRVKSPAALDAANVSMATKGPRGIPYTQEANQQWVDSVSRWLEQNRMGALADQGTYR